MHNFAVTAGVHCMSPWNVLCVRVHGSDHIPHIMHNYIPCPCTVHTPYTAGHAYMSMYGNGVKLPWIIKDVCNTYLLYIGRYVGW